MFGGIPRGSVALCASGLAALSLTSPSRASVPLEVVVHSGAPVPGTTPQLYFDGFGNAVVNDHGHVGFLGFVSDTDGTAGGAGIFGPDAAGRPTLIALSSEPVPGMPAGTEWRFLSTYYPRLNDDGELTFHSGLAGPGIEYPTHASAIWSWSATDGLALRAQAGDELPEIGEKITLGPIGGGLTLPAIDPSARVGFAGSLYDDGQPTVDTVVLSSGSTDGPPTVIASARTPVPDVPGAEFTYLHVVGVNPAGEWTLVGYFEGPGVIAGENDSASLLADPTGSLTTLVRTGDPAPGMPSGVVFGGPGWAYRSESGAFVLRSVLAGPGVGEADGSVLYRSNESGQMVLLAREGHGAPGTEPGTVFESFELFSNSIVINSSAWVAFAAGLVGPAVDASNSDGIWTFDPVSNELELQVRAGDSAIELPDLTLASISAPILNERGDLVFRAALAGPGVTTQTDEAIFVIYADGTRQKVFRKGEVVSFGAGDERSLVGGLSMLPGTWSDSPGLGQLSDNGFLTFTGHTVDGTNAIVVASLPEPQRIVALAHGLVVVFVLRQRSIRRSTVG